MFYIFRKQNKHFKSSVGDNSQLLQQPRKTNKEAEDRFIKSFCRQHSSKWSEKLVFKNENLHL